MAPAWLPATNQLEEQADLLQRISQCADHSKPGLLHGAILLEAEVDSWLVRLEARDKRGLRQEAEDLELEIYGSAQNPSIQIGWLLNSDQPLLWLGRHPVWMDPNTGMQLERPEAGINLETLGRRLRTLLIQG